MNEPCSSGLLVMSVLMEWGGL